MEESLFKKILIAVDGSENAYIAAQKGITIAKQNKAEVFALYVIDSDVVTDLSRAHDKSDSETKTQLKEVAQIYLNDIKKLCKENKIKCTELISEGHTVNVILKESKQHSVDLIVLAHHSRTKAEIVRVGSVSLGVIEFAPCTILIVEEKKR
jgi:nucleotide-binding universal stress UspA family protein